jgi:hypothetical protein
MFETDTTEVLESPQTNETVTAPSNEPATSKPSSPAPAKSAAPEGTVTGDKSVEPSADAETAADKGELQKLRETLAGGDEKLLQSLERYKSVEAVSKAFREARNAAKTAGKPLTLSDKATEAEVKAYREAYGIPDEAADYPLNFREGFEASEVDKALLDSAKEYVHAKNGDPRTAGIMMEWYQDAMLQQQQELSANLANVAKKTQSELRAEWGGEFDGNISAAGELMKSQLGEDGFKDMMSLRLMDGSRLQDNVAFVKMMAQLGNDYYGGNAIMNGDVETTSRTVQEKIDELLQLRLDSPEKYKSDEVQGKITALYAQRAKLQARR